MQQWIEDVNKLQNKVKYYELFVGEADFKTYKAGSFGSLINALK
ncbi:MAG: hypothetical protein ACREGF_00705 [Candidatus Saccharimonadales bacterium]